MINLIKLWADGDLCLPPLPSGMNNVFNGSHLDKSDLYLQQSERDADALAIFISGFCRIAGFVHLFRSVHF